MTGRGDPPPDPWLDARRRARADVAAALAPRRRTCPRCGAEQGTAATRRCSRCGAELVAHRPRSRLQRDRIVALTVVVVALGAPATALVLESRERAAREERAAAVEQAARESAERRTMRREGRPRTAQIAATASGDVARARRRAVRTAERLITGDARARVRAGILDGPVIGARCLPEPRTAPRLALESDPDARRLVYDCVALKSRFEAPPDDGRRRVGYFGHPFRAVIEPHRRRLTWCRVFPPAGEGARSLAIVALHPACRARAAGTGGRR